MITLDGLSVQAGERRIQGLDLQADRGETIAIMGRTGVGKTSLLEALCGLRPVLAGRLIINGADVTEERPGRRGIGYVPQDLALFSTMSVSQHLGFALRTRRAPASEIRRRVAELAERLGLTQLLQRRPGALSGGERQRVALGRALAARPPVLCLDEPLTALDEDTRGQMQELLTSITSETGVTTLHVTHSSAEARALGDHMLVIQDDHWELSARRGPA